MVVSAAIMAGGALAAGGLGIAGSNAASRKQYEYQRRLQEQAAALNYSYNSKWAQNGPTFTRQGLESAGYNPMLAVQNGTSNATSFASSGQAQNVDYNSSIQAGFSNAVDYQRLKNETVQTQSNVDLQNKQSEAAEATAANQNAQAQGQLEDNKYISARNKAQIGNLQAQTQHFNAMIDNMQARIKLDRELGYMGFANARDIANIQASASRYGADVSAAASRYASDTGYGAATYRSWSDHVRNLGIGIGGITGVYRDLKGSNNYPSKYPSYNRYGNPRAYFDYP